MQQMGIAEAEDYLLSSPLQSVVSAAIGLLSLARTDEEKSLLSYFRSRIIIFSLAGWRILSKRSPRKKVQAGTASGNQRRFVLGILFITLLKPMLLFLSSWSMAIAKARESVPF